MRTRKVKCNKCEYVGSESEFPKDRDFLQVPFIAKCPKCDNWQSPGGASMRMMPGNKHPFEYVRDEPPKNAAPIETVLHDAGEAS